MPEVMLVDSAVSRIPSGSSTPRRNSCQHDMWARLASATPSNPMPKLEYSYSAPGSRASVYELKNAYIFLTV